MEKILKSIKEFNKEELFQIKEVIDKMLQIEINKIKEKIVYTTNYNKYIPITIICPTRERCQGIYYFLDSAYNTCWSCDNFEIIFVCDEDDKASPAWIDICKEKFPKMDISYHIRERTEFLNRDYFNWAVQFGKGKYFWVTGDDLIFVHPEWDKCIFDYLDIYYGREFDRAKPPRDDKIVYINVQDDTPKPEDIDYPFSCFPIISKKAIETVGFLMIPEIPSWCSDYPIALLYSQVNRFMDLSEKIFKHQGVETKFTKADSITARLDKIMKKYNSPSLAEEWIKNQLPKLKGKIINSIGGPNKIGGYRR